MWEVRFLEVDAKGFELLNGLNCDVFTSVKHDVDNTHFVEHFIRFAGHDNDQPTKVLEIAEKHLKVYAAVLKLNGYEIRPKVDHPCKINEDGTRCIYLSLEDRIDIKDHLEISQNGEVTYSSIQAKNDLNKSLVANALADEDKKEILILLGEEHNWINAYKIYEILRKKFRNEKELKSYEELKYFAHSANSPEAIGISNARHAVQDHQNPKKIADLETSYKRLIELSVEYIAEIA